MSLAYTPEKLSFDAARLSHAYITGRSIADAIAMTAVCSGAGSKKPCLKCANCGKASRGSHPDIIIVEKPPDKTKILVGQIRSLKKDAIVVPTESDRKVYIIVNAELMRVEAQNAFLQLLEDPPRYAVFILSTDSPSALLQTVRSRCVELNAGSLSVYRDEAAMEIANELFSALDDGNISLARFMFRLEKLDRDTLSRFLPAAREQAAARLASAATATTATTALSASSASSAPSATPALSAPSATPALSAPSADPEARRETLARVEQALCRAMDMLELNVNAGHISGLICATLMN